jgi:hypothetical protein
LKNKLTQINNTNLYLINDIKKYKEKLENLKNKIKDENNDNKVIQENQEKNENQDLFEENKEVINKNKNI